MSEEQSLTYWQPKAGEGGMTGLHSAAYAGDLEALLAGISDGADVNARDYGDWTPLHCKRLIWYTPLTPRCARPSTASAGDR